MLRICHIISGDLWAGAEVMAAHLLKGLGECPGLHISVILLNDGRLAEELRASGLLVHLVDESRHSFGRIVREAGDFLGRHPARIIHTHRYKENLLALLLRRRFAGIELVSTQHGLPEPVRAPAVRRTLMSRLNLFVMRHYFRTVAVSNDIRAHLTGRCGFAADKVTVIHNGIALPSAPVRRRRTGAFVIGSSGRLFAVKDYPLMVRIAREAVEAEPEIRFRLAGEGPERAPLQERIAAAGLEERFSLDGHLDAMDDFYRDIDLYLNTSVHEGIPMTILEAMAHGLPVVAPRVGGIAEIVEDGREGFLIDGRDPAAFARKCLLLQRDGALWRRMSEAARRRALAHFGVERMTDEYRRLYREVAAAGGAASRRRAGAAPCGGEVK